jgi:hypothetical protein
MGNRYPATLDKAAVMAGSVLPGNQSDTCDLFCRRIGREKPHAFQARRSGGQYSDRRVDNFLTDVMPGYAVAKGVFGGVAGKEDTTSVLTPGTGAVR